MGDLIDKYDFGVTSALTAAWYRILGQASVPFKIEDFLGYVGEQIQGDGGYSGRLTWKRKTNIVWWFIWDNVNMSQKDIPDPVIGRFHIWGRPGGHNTVITRGGWQKLYLIRSEVEKSLGVDKWTLSLR